MAINIQPVALHQIRSDSRCRRNNFSLGAVLGYNVLNFTVLVPWTVIIHIILHASHSKISTPII
uniref:Transmembrane protein n=1 Tax=Human betaherpesvirus 6 TaxID=10368 RepID=A0A5P9U5E9_9BETA|nr:hypothetical protein [Human betaherpesvirus 6]